MAGQQRTYKIGRSRDDIGIERVEDELLILDKHNQKVHQRNATASPIWDSISAGNDTNSIVRDIAGAYDVSAATAAQDVAKVIDELCALGLLEEPAKNSNN